MKKKKCLKCKKLKSIEEFKKEYKNEEDEILCNNCRNLLINSKKKAR